MDAGFNALQPGYVPDDNADRGEKIYVFCGGEDTSNMSCAPAPWSDQYLAAGWQPYRVGWPAIAAMFDSSYRMSAGPVNVTFISTGIVVAAPATSAVFSQAGVAVVLSGAILSKFLSDAFGFESEEQTFVMPEQPHIPEEPPSGPAPITEPAPISGPPIP